jgi:hypothetical protein
LPPQYVMRVISERRKRAATATRVPFSKRLRKRWRSSSSGALTRKPWSSLELVSGLRPRLHIAERRAARKARIISTHRAVCALLGLPGRLSGLFPVRAALSASRESDLLLLLLLRRRWRWWRRFGCCSTFRQRDRRGPQVRSDPSPVAAGSLYPGTPHSAQSPQSPTEQALS